MDAIPKPVAFADAFVAPFVLFDGLDVILAPDDVELLELPPVRAATTPE